MDQWTNFCHPSSATSPKSILHQCFPSHFALVSSTTPQTQPKITLSIAFPFSTAYNLLEISWDDIIPLCHPLHLAPVKHDLANTNRWEQRWETCLHGLPRWGLWAGRETTANTIKGHTATAVTKVVSGKVVWWHRWEPNHLHPHVEDAPRSSCYAHSSICPSTYSVLLQKQKYFLSLGPPR